MTIKIEADPDLVDLLPEYIDKRKAELATLQEAVNNNDHEKIKSIAHSTKGHAAGYGFDGLGQICEEMDDAINSGDIETVKHCIARYADYINNVEIV